MTTSSVPARVAAEAERAEQEARAGLAALAAVATPPQEELPPPPQEPQPAPPPPPSVQPVPDVNQLLARQQAQLDSLIGRQQQLVDQNAALARELAEARRAPPPAPTPPAGPPMLATADEIKEYGQDLIDLMGRIGTIAARSVMGDVTTRLAALEGRIGSVQQTTQQVQQTAQEMAFGRYMATLDASIPGWKAVNDDPAFLTWLAEKDGFSGKTRHDLLSAAHEALDAERVAAIFTAYKPDLRSAPPAAPAPQTPPAPAAPHIDPATLAAPPTAPAAPPPATPPAGRLWKQSEVDKLYEDKQKGRISPQLFEAEEREYMKALSEGRVIADQ